MDGDHTCRLALDIFKPKQITRPLWPRSNFFGARKPALSDGVFRHRQVCSTTDEEIALTILQIVTTSLKRFCKAITKPPSGPPVAPAPLKWSRKIGQPSDRSRVCPGSGRPPRAYIVASFVRNVVRPYRCTNHLLGFGPVSIAVVKLTDPVARHRGHR